MKVSFPIDGRALLKWLCLGGLAVVALSGTIPARETSASPTDVIFKALLIDGKNVTGRIVAFGASDVTIATKEGNKEVLAFDRLVKLTRESTGTVSLAAGPGNQSMFLGDGDRLMRVGISKGTDDSLSVSSELLGDFDVPLDSMLGMILATTDRPEDNERRAARIVTGERRNESLWLQNGDRLDGDFLGMDQRKIRFRVNRKPIEVDRSGVLGVGFDPKLLHYPAPKEAFLEATFDDGSRLGLTSIKLVEGNIKATTRFDQSIECPLSSLVWLHARSKAVVYLAQRKPLQAVYENYVGPSRPFQVDRAVDGHPLVLGETEYHRGIGTQSRTFLAYRIESGDRRFQATIGVDRRAGPLGSVIFRVFVDREERFKSSTMTDRDPPRTLDIDLAGGKILILVTEFGDRGSVRDLADWAEARIIR